VQEYASEAELKLNEMNK